MTVCHRDRKEACEGRYAMVRRGLCWYSWEMQAWLIVRDGIPTQHVRCPWCGGFLPTLVDRVLRMLADREDDA
jgi:hypothetical protein